jgi:hypothetical protein
MPCTMSWLACSVQRRRAMLPGQFELRVPNDTDRLEHLRCPYCQVQTESSIGCARHIMLTRECRERRLKDVKAERRRRLELAYATAGPSSRPAGPTRQITPRARAQTPRARAQTPRAREKSPDITGPQWSDYGRTCGEPVVEHCPISTAGAPISEERTYPEDLSVHMARCGNMANLGYFEGAELLMTTGLNGKGRQAHLQSSFVSSCSPPR